MDSGKMWAIFLAPIAAQLFLKAQAKWHAYLDERDRKRAAARQQDSWAVASVIIGRITHDPESSPTGIGRNSLPASPAIEQSLGENVAITESASDPAASEPGQRP